MSDAIAAKVKDLFVGGKGTLGFLLCLLFFLFAVALLLCGFVSPCIAGAIIFIGLALCCCSSCW